MRHFRHLLVLFFWLAMAAAPLRAEEAGQFSCRENRPGCRLLQLVMAGSFDEYDPEDTLGGRVLSAVYPQLCALTGEDMAHYAREFSEEEETVKEHWRTALANCLWANLRCEPAADTTSGYVRKILLLFLDPGGTEDAGEQMKEIRSGMTEEILELLAENTGAPRDFLEWLIGAGKAEESQPVPD